MVVLGRNGSPRSAAQTADAVAVVIEREGPEDEDSVVSPHQFQGRDLKGKRKTHSRSPWLLPFKCPERGKRTAQPSGLNSNGPAGPS